MGSLRIDFDYAFLLVKTSPMFGGTRFQYRLEVSREENGGV